MKIFEATIARLDSNVWAYHFKVPNDISRYYLDSTGSRVVCTINNAVSYHAALMPAGDGQYFINVNKEVRKKLRLDLGSTVQISLVADESKYGLPVPEEFTAWIEQDPLGDQYFHALTKGKQRNLLYIMGKPKRSETRLLKTMAIFEYLKSTEGKLDFRALLDFIKRYNQLNG